MTSARVKCEQAEEAAKMAVADAELAKSKARDYLPNSRHPGEKIIANRLQEEDLSAEFADFDGNPDQPPLQAQQSPKKFSFFKLKKDVSVRGVGGGGGGGLGGDRAFDTLPRQSAAATVTSPTASFSAAPQRQVFTQTFHVHTSSQPRNAPSPSQTMLPPLPNSTPHPQSQQQQQLQPSGQYIMNDFRAHQQAGYHGGLTGAAGPGVQQIPGGQMTPVHAWPPTEQQWTPTHQQPTYSQQTGTLTPTRGEPVFASNVAHYPRPDGALVTSQGHGFDDSYNWMAYGDFRERRKSLPSIVKDKQDFPLSAKLAEVKAAATGSGHPQSPTGSTAPQPRPQVDTYVIENGVRKRVKPLYADLRAPQRAQTLTAADKGPQRLPKKLYELESPKMYRKGDKGSMPDVSAIKDADILPREAVYVMSQQRREALMIERAEEERRRRNQIVLRLGDLKDWCERRQVLVFVLAVNISLATVFYNMLQ